MPPPCGRHGVLRRRRTLVVNVRRQVLPRSRGSVPGRRRRVARHVFFFGRKRATLQRLNEDGRRSTKKAIVAAVASGEKVGVATVQNSLQREQFGTVHRATVCRAKTGWKKLGGFGKTCFQASTRSHARPVDYDTDGMRRLPRTSVPAKRAVFIARQKRCTAPTSAWAQGSSHRWSATGTRRDLP